MSEEKPSLLEIRDKVIRLYVKKSGKKNASERARIHGEIRELEDLFRDLGGDLNDKDFPLATMSYQELVELPK